MTRRGFLAGVALGTAGCAGAGAPAAQSHPPIGRFVQAEGLRIHATDEGAGPPVVLIHGASGNLRDFTFSMSGALAATGARVVAFDRPGLGWSDRAAERGWDPAVQARVLRAAAAEMGVARPVVVGHSWGGAVAMAWALQDPAGTAGVVSLAGATYPWGTGVSGLYAVAASPVFGGLARAAAGLLIDADDPASVVGRIFKPNAIPAGYADYVGVPLALRQPAFRHNAEDLKNLDALLRTQAPGYAALTMPIEAVHGEADTTVDLAIHSGALARDVADGRLTALPGVGHMPHHAAEGACLAAVGRVLERTAA